MNGDDMRVRYITDFGVNLTLTLGDGTNQELERYGVWSWSSRGKYEVVEVGNDLAALMSAHNVPHERVVRMDVSKQEPGDA